MLGKHQPAELNLVGVSGNAPPIEPNPKHRRGRKRKTTYLPDTPSQGVGSSASQGLRSAKRLTLVPKQLNHVEFSSSSSGAANRFGFSGDLETHRVSPTQPTIASTSTRPSLGERDKGTGYLPANNLLSGSTPMHGGTRVPNDSISKEGLLGLDYLALYDLGVLKSVNHIPQDPGFGHAGALASIPNVQGLEMSPGVQLSDQQWTGSTGSLSVTSPWESHLERIMSLGMAVSQISRKFKSTTIQPLCEVDVDALLEQSNYLQQSYFKLKKCVQLSMPSSEGGQRSGELTTI